MAFAPCEEMPPAEQQPTVSGRLEIRIQPTSSSPIQTSNHINQTRVLCRLFSAIIFKKNFSQNSNNSG